MARGMVFAVLLAIAAVAMPDFARAGSPVTEPGIPVTEPGNPVVEAGNRLAPPGRVAAIPAADSVRITAPVGVHGGRLLSTREVRASLGTGAAGGWLTGARAEAALRQLGAARSGRLPRAPGLALGIDSLGRATLEVAEGPGACWDTLAAPGTAGAPFPLRPARGAEFDADQLTRALRGWVEAALENGYPFASARVESLSVAGGRVHAGLRLDPGPACRVEEISFPGRTSTRESFLRRWIGYRAGAPYRESAWRDARRRLEQAGLFSFAGEARVELRPDGGVKIVLPVQEIPHNRMEGAIGYSGRTKAVTGLVDLELGNLLGTGRRFAVRWERVRKDQSRLRLEARDPYLGPLPLGVRLAVEQELRDSTYTSASFELLGEVTLARDFTALAGVEYRRAVLGAEPAERHRRFSSVFGGTWSTQRPGAWTGGRLETTYRSGRTRIRPAGGGPESKSRLDRAEVKAERFLGLGSLAVRLALNGAAVARADSLPPSEALRFGGATMLRGFAEEAFVTRRHAAGQLEIGPAWEEARAYLFLDAAVWRPVARGSRDRDDLGFGVGLAQQSAGRRVVIDLAIPRGGSIADGRLHARVESRF